MARKKVARNHSKTRWAFLSSDKFLEVVGRGIGPAIIGGVVVYVGHVANVNLQTANHRLQQLSEETKRTNLMIDVTSRQKELDVEVGMRLLEKVLQEFSKLQSLPIRQKQSGHSCCCYNSFPSICGTSQ